jgi:NAD(P)-dependent dehydrogenase (short-subunit alcohol dehydrogenase family)
MAIVVTGASRGIGRATALELASRGHALSLVGRPSSALDRAAVDARSRGVAVNVVPCDLCDPDAIGGAARRIESESGVPEAIVHNAGIVHRQSIEETTDASWDEQLAVNLRAPFQLTRALLPSMKAVNAGRLVYVGSISSTLGSKNAAAYCASKWGLVGFMKSVAEDLSETGLMAMAILPGSVDTEMLEGSGFSARMSAEDVAKTIAYFAVLAPRSHNGGVVEMFGT